MDWFLYDRDLHHERVKVKARITLRLITNKVRSLLEDTDQLKFETATLLKSHFAMGVLL